MAQDASHTAGARRERVFRVSSGRDRADHVRMARWRTSTWVFVVLALGAVVGEVIYATSSNPTTQEHQGAAIAWLIAAGVIFAFYRAVTRERRGPSRVSRD